MSEDSQPVEESTDEAAPAKAPPAEETLREKLEASRREGAELLTRMKYLQAEFENFRKRSSRETEALVKIAHEGLLLRLLPVLDEFDAALAHLDGEAARGVRMVRDNLWKVLQEVGLQEVPALGESFDPYVHECVERVPRPDHEENTVLEVVRKGYRMHDRLLRPAQVIVASNGGDSNA